MTPLHYKRLWLLYNKKKKNYTYSNGQTVKGRPFYEFYKEV